MWKVAFLHLTLLVCSVTSENSTRDAILSGLKHFLNEGGLMVLSEDLEVSYLLDRPILMMSPNLSRQTIERAAGQVNNVLVSATEEELDYLTDFLPVRNCHVFLMKNVKLLTQSEKFEDFNCALFAIIGRDHGRIQFWERNGVFASELRLLDKAEVEQWPKSTRKFSSLQQGSRKSKRKTVVAAGFHFPPYSVLDFETGRHSGIEYDITATVVNALRRDMKVQLPGDGAFWGRETPPGSGNYTGLLGELQHGRVDVGWANLYKIHSRSQFMDFTVWYWMTENCALTEKSKPYPKIMALLLIFDWRMWVSVLGTAVASLGFLLMIQHRRSYQSQGVTPCDVGNLTSRSLTLILAALVAQSTPLTQHILSSWPVAKLGGGVVLLGFFVVTAAFSSGLISVLTVNIYPPPIATLERLSEVAEEWKAQCVSDSGGGVAAERDCLPVFTGPSIVDFMKQSLLESHRKLASLSDTLPIAEIPARLKGRPGSMILTREATYFFISSHLTDSRGATNMTIMGDCFKPTPIAIGLRKRNPLKPFMDKKITQLREAGLVKKWMSDALEKGGQLTHRMASFRPASPLTLYELEGPVILWLVFLTLSIIIFAGETIISTVG